MSTQCVSKEIHYFGVELLVEGLAVEAGWIRANVMCASSQLVRAGRQERKVLRVWDGADIRLHGQFIRDSADALGCDTVITALGTPQLNRHTDFVEGSLREEGAQRIRNDKRLDAPVMDQRSELALTNVLADRAGLTRTHSDVPAESRIGTHHDEPRVPAS